MQDGPPGQTCVKALKTTVNETYGVLALVLLITALLVFMGFNAQYGLWRRRFERKDGAKDRARNYLVEESA